MTLTRQPSDGRLQIYLDGVLDKEELSDPGSRGANVLDTFGRNTDGGFVIGGFDEVRALTTVVSPSWVWASYQTVTLAAA